MYPFMNCWRAKKFGLWASNNQHQNNQPVLSEANVLERKSWVMWASRACKSALAKPRYHYSEVGE